MILLIVYRRIGQKRNFKHELSSFYCQLRTTFFCVFFFFLSIAFSRVIIVCNMERRDLWQAHSRLLSSMCIGADGDVMSPGWDGAEQEPAQLGLCNFRDKFLIWWRGWDKSLLRGLWKSPVWMALHITAEISDELWNVLIVIWVTG